MKGPQADIELMNALMLCAAEIKDCARHPMATVGEEKILTANALIISAIVGMMTDMARIKAALGLYDKPEAGHGGATATDPSG